MSHVRTGNPGATPAAWPAGRPLEDQLASGADTNVVQRVLGTPQLPSRDLLRAHDRRNLWDAAQRLRGHHGGRPDEGPDNEGGALAEVAVDEGGDLALERQAIAF
jgi:hypothetical protein